MLFTAGAVLGLHLGADLGLSDCLDWSKFAYRIRFRFANRVQTDIKFVPGNMLVQICTTYCTRKCTTYCTRKHICTSLSSRPSKTLPDDGLFTTQIFFLCDEKCVLRLVNNPPTSPHCYRFGSVNFGNPKPKPINWVIGFGWQTEVGPYTLVTREAFTLATQR